MSLFAFCGVALLNADLWALHFISNNETNSKFGSVIKAGRHAGVNQEIEIPSCIASPRCFYKMEDLSGGGPTTMWLSAYCRLYISIFDTYANFQAASRFSGFSGGITLAAGIIGEPMPIHGSPISSSTGPQFCPDGAAR